MLARSKVLPFHFCCMSCPVVLAWLPYDSSGGSHECPLSTMFFITAHNSGDHLAGGSWQNSQVPFTWQPRELSRSVGAQSGIWPFGQVTSLVGMIILGMRIL